MLTTYFQLVVAMPLGTERHLISTHLPINKLVSKFKFVIQYTNIPMWFTKVMHEPVLARTTLFYRRREKERGGGGRGRKGAVAWEGAGQC